MEPPPAPVGLEIKEEALRVCLQRVGVSEVGYRLLVGCFTLGYLNCLPKPKRKFRQGNYSSTECSRHLFYQKFANLLGWCDRHQLLAKIYAILKDKVYLDVECNVKFQRPTELYIS
jgi:hypothetical protein